MPMAVLAEQAQGSQQYNAKPQWQPSLTPVAAAGHQADVGGQMQMAV